MKQRKMLLALYFLLSFLGLILSGFALYEHIAISAGIESATVLCKLSEQVNCASVLGSKWSELFGIPLASFGLFFYSALFLLSAFCAADKLMPRPLAGALLFALSTFSLLCSIGLFLISKFAIGAICPVCFGTYIINFGLFLTSYFLDRSRSWYQRLIEGVKQLSRFPLLVLGHPSAMRAEVALSRFACVVLLFVLANIAFLPDFLISKFLVASAQKQDALAQWQAENEVELPIDTASGLMSDYGWGPEDAPIQIVEFSDFECPACRAVYVMLEDAAKEHPGKVRVIYKNFPLDRSCNPFIPKDFHRNACFAAEFARCAGEQGKFQSSVDFLFRAEVFEENLDPDQLKQYLLSSAEGLGLDSLGMEECLESGRHKERIVQDIKEGVALGVEGTPSLWVNGKRFMSLSPAGLKAIFEEIQ